jgi:uncharacterized protein (TIGR00251 family)
MVKPSQSINRIKLEGEQVIISVKTPPTKGKANRTLIQIAKKLFQREVIIISGIKRTNKTLLVKNISINKAIELLETKTGSKLKKKGKRG